MIISTVLVIPAAVLGLLASGKVIGGATAALGGVLQLATGLSQLRKANKLPFPNYSEGLKYAQDTNRLYKENFEKGLGQEKMDMMRRNVGAQSIQNYRNVFENAPQLASSYGRVTALDRINTEKALAQMDYSYRQSQLGGLTRTGAEISDILKTDIAAKRQYKTQAEMAAGEAIKTGSENVMRAGQILGGYTTG
jgi:hypothetical protein